MNGIGAFELSDAEARRVATEFGTPVYVVDETHFRNNIRRYRSAQGTAHGTELYYASKANPSPALMKIAWSEGLLIDVASAGEFLAALHGGVPASACNFHGNAKSDQELELTIRQEIGSITIDESSEVERIARIVQEIGAKAPEIMVRLLPGVDPITHPHVRTGQYDSKFGIAILDGSAKNTVARCLELGLPLVGFHAHVGSQLFDPNAQEASAAILGEFAVQVERELGYRATKLNLGGGVGVAYTEAQPQIDLADYCHRVQEAARRPFLESGLPVPVLAQEPGRALIANASVALYSVAAIKQIPTVDGGRQTFVAIDGGLSDNPRPSLYQSQYTVTVISEPHHDGNTLQSTVSGKHCETDTMFRDITVPTQTQRGDLVQVLVCGAYQMSMASNYNRYPKPAMVLRRLNGSHDCIQRREPLSKLTEMDYVPEDLE